MQVEYRLAVLGDPIAHSLSPEIHRRFGELTGTSIDYQAIRTGPEELADRLADLAHFDADGANLTVPLKRHGLDYCASLSRAAREAGAVNTLSRSGGQWHGHNTDGDGLLRDFERLDIEVRDQRVLIVGAGGATAGILGPLLRAGPETVWLLNRSADRARALADAFAGHGRVRAGGLDEQPPPEAGCEVLIQATSLGHESQTPPLDRAWLSDSARAYDLNYGPAHAPFADWCRATGVVCHDGLGMLIAQAALAFEIWTGQAAPIGKVVSAMRAID